MALEVLWKQKTGIALFQYETCETEFAAFWIGKFSCEKCKNEFPSIRSLKKHLRRIHEGKDLALEENSKISISVNTCVS